MGSWRVTRLEHSHLSRSLRTQGSIYTVHCRYFTAGLFLRGFSSACFLGYMRRGLFTHLFVPRPEAPWMLDPSIVTSVTSTLIHSAICRIGLAIYTTRRTEQSTYSRSSLPVTPRITNNSTCHPRRPLPRTPRAPHNPHPRTRAPPRPRPARC